MTSVQIHPRLAHWTSLIGAGLEVHRSTRRKVSRRSRNRSRSHGTKVGRVEEEEDVFRLEGREILRMESRTEVILVVSLSLSRTFLIERLRSWATVAGPVVDGFDALSVARGLEIDSSTRWNLRFFDSTAYDISAPCREAMRRTTNARRSGCANKLPGQRCFCLRHEYQHTSPRATCCLEY